MALYEFYHAARAYEPEEIIDELGDTPCDPEDPRRLQVSEDRFILPPHIYAHSCEPNAYIDWQQLALRALRIIEEGDLISYHYGTSEYEFGIGAFDCNCESDQCVGHFSGFSSMTEEQRSVIINFISPFIRGRVSQERDTNEQDSFGATIFE